MKEQKKQRYCAYQREHVVFSKGDGKFAELVCERSFPVKTNQHICDARCIHSVTSAAIREIKKAEPAKMIEEALRIAGAQDYTSDGYMSRNMVCDICSVGITGREMHIFKYSEILNATNHGYVPTALINPQKKILNLERDGLVQEDLKIDRDIAATWWKSQIDQHVGEDYGLCDTCQKGLRQYLQPENDQKYLQPDDDQKEPKTELDRLKERLATNKEFAKLTVDRDGENLKFTSLSEKDVSELVNYARNILGKWWQFWK